MEPLEPAYDLGGAWDALGFAPQDLPPYPPRDSSASPVGVLFTMPLYQRCGV